MLLTRSPLSPAPKGRFSLDLHVLSAPPAFVLSQDQTLREEVFAGKPASFRHFELVLKVCLRRDMTGLFVSSPTGKSRPPRSRRKRTLLSFQRPRRLEVRPVKKPPTRARGLQNHRDLRRIRVRPKALQLFELQGLSYVRPVGSRGMIAALMPSSSA